MQCPVCNVELKITDRQGIEIDYCPTCRGVWLDRGELDKLIERSTQRESLPTTAAPTRRDQREEFYPEDYDDDYEYKRKNDDRYDSGDRYPAHGKKKKSFLGEMFDIFD